MPDLQFEIESAGPTPNAAVPQITFRVRITDAEAQRIQSMAVRVQVQIEPVRRRYSAAEQEHLKELFGEPEQWSKSLQPLLWANVNLNVQGFERSTNVDVPVPCTFDFNVATTKYIHGLEDGELPVSLLFSGTIFYAGAAGLQIAQIPWEKQAGYRLPVRVWKEMIDRYYPNSAWLCLRRDVFEQLYEFKSRYGIPTWEQTLERVLSLATTGTRNPGVTTWDTQSK